MTKQSPELNIKNFEFQHALIKTVLESSPDGVLVVNEQGLIISYNSRFVEIWELSLSHQSSEFIPYIALGVDDAPILSAVTQRVKDPTVFLARVQELYAHPDLDDHCELELIDGRTIERHSTALWSDEHDYLGRVWFFRDITSHKKIENKLVELTRQDPLTGVANRRYFHELSLQEMVRAQRYLTPLSIASIDLDHFKRINDVYGHAVGDKMLKALCNVIQQMLRENELFARIGGEEFAILMPNTSLQGALYLAERIRQAAAENKLIFNNQEISCTISIGIAELKPTDGSIDDCLGRADKAMYKAKQHGRNRVESES
ncbi:MAG: diguanylate cyclase [Gammaproteobacteria bacterium]|nr:diguanylate cyclase [Gammaproteobacteria bacterium]